MTSEQNISKTKKNNQSIPKILKYCAAALSVVSFLTTMQGVDELIVDSTLMAGMISFAVQGIILVLGLQFIKVWRTITTSYKEHGAARRALHGIIIGLYIASTAFSSFFSFVYITNSAYKDVGKTDYNMEIDQFLVDSANKLEQINSERCDELVNSIRENTDGFDDFLQQNKKMAEDKTNEIIDSITKYDISTIEEHKCTVEGALDALKVEYPDIDEDRIAQVENGFEEFTNDFNEFIGYYERYYKDYSILFDRFKKSDDTLSVEDIDKLISLIKVTKDNLSKATTQTENSILEYISNKRRNISLCFDNLINALEILKNSYAKIANNQTVQAGGDSKLPDLYNIIYSSDILAEEKIDTASEQLRILITNYLNTHEDGNETEANIGMISQCIANLDELKERNKLQKEITVFKSNQLNKVYNIEIPSEETNAESSTEVPRTEQDVTNVSEDGLDVDTVNPEEWKNERRWHINQFIGLLKRVPRSDDDENAELSEMLDTAYELSRRNLQPISEMEIALNFLKSEHKTVAWIGVAIAIFLDIASFLIGIILFFYKPDDEKKTTLEGSSVDEVGQTA